MAELPPQIFPALENHAQSCCVPPPSASSCFCIDKNINNFTLFPGENQESSFWKGVLAPRQKSYLTEAWGTRSSLHRHTLQAIKISSWGSQDYLYEWQLCTAFFNALSHPRRLSYFRYAPKTTDIDNTTQGSKQEKIHLASLVIKTREAPSEKMAARKEIYRHMAFFHPKSSKDSIAKEDRV